MQSRQQTTKGSARLLWMISLVGTLLVLLFALMPHGGGNVATSFVANHDHQDEERVSSSPGAAVARSFMKVASQQQERGLEGDAGFFAGAAPVAVERKRVYTADVQLVVKDLDILAIKVVQLAEANGGFIVSSSKRDDHLQSQFRVRASALKDTLEALTHLGDNIMFVDSISQRGNDVTDQFEDLEARIRVYNATRETLLELLKKAVTVQDVLQVQNQLTQTNQNLDVLIGQRKRMEGDVSLSAINVYARKFIDRSLPRPFWNAAEQFSHALNALYATITRIASATIYILVFLPAILVLLLIFYCLTRFVAGRTHLN